MHIPLSNRQEIPDAGRICTKSGDKCAGSVGNPEVVYAGCCDERLSCGVPTALPAGAWGQFCISPTDVDVDATAAANEGSVAVTTAVPETDTTVPLTTADGTTIVGTVVDVSDDDGDAATATTTATPTPVSEASEGGIIDTSAFATSDDDGSVCFPASATVELRSGEVVRMDSLSVGDVVKVGVNKYSRIFMFTHKTARSTYNFVTLQTKSGASLSLTAGHYLYVNGALAAAKTVRVGDVLTLGSGKASAVTEVGAHSGDGLYNPQTVSGDVVVNGLLASTYTTAVEPAFAHALLAPLRALHRLGLGFTGLESGGGKFASVAPRGRATV